MKQHLNTLFVTTERAYLARDGEAVAVRVEKEVRLRVPLLNLGSIVAFGSVGASPGLMASCAKAGVAMSFLDRHGRFLARVSGFTPGNVLLRREQYRRSDDDAATLAIARPMVVAKIANARTGLLRSARDHPDPARRAVLQAVAERLVASLNDAQAAAALDTLRGVEGDAANVYFSAFNGMFTNPASGFALRGRTRRPPLDAVNALLSFLYAMLTLDARAACESAGLDPQVGFLHRDRPGRPSLALDLIEEFRPYLADRLVLALINRQQVSPGGFAADPAGGVTMTDDTRRAVLVAYQKRKQETITHPFLNEPTTVGLLVHLQARLLARHLRGDLDSYPPFVWR